MERNDGLGLLAGRHHRIPVARVQSRQPEFVGCLRKGDRAKTTLCVASNLFGADLGIEQIGELHRNDSAGIAARPLLEAPIVPGAHRRERELRILRRQLQALSGEARQERREIHRSPDAGQVHVLDAVMDVPSARAHLVEAGGLEAVLRDGAAHDGVEPDVGHDFAGVFPDFAAVFGLHDARRAILERLREATLEGVAWFHDVVIDGDDGPTAFLARGFGQKGDLPLARSSGDREAHVLLEIIEIGHRHVPPHGVSNRSDRATCLFVLELTRRVDY